MGNPIANAGMFLVVCGAVVGLCMAMTAFHELEFAHKTFPYAVSIVDGVHEYTISYSLMSGALTGDLVATATTYSEKYYGVAGLYTSADVVAIMPWEDTWTLCGQALTAFYATAQCAGAGSAVAPCSGASGYIAVKAGYDTIEAGRLAGGVAAVKAQGSGLMDQFVTGDTTGTFDEVLPTGSTTSVDATNADLLLTIKRASTYSKHKDDFDTCEKDCDGKCSEMVTGLTVVSLVGVALWCAAVALGLGIQNDADGDKMKQTGMVWIAAGFFGIANLLYFYLTCGQSPVPDYVKAVQTSSWGGGIWALGVTSVCLMGCGVWCMKQAGGSRSSVRPYR